MNRETRTEPKRIDPERRGLQFMGANPIRILLVDDHPVVRKGIAALVSAQILRRKRLLQSDRMARLFLQVLYFYRRQGKYLLHEFVVMPNHIHLLIRPAPDVTLERASQLIKGRFSFEAGKRFGMIGDLWQRSFHDRRVRDLGEYMKYRKYIHSNPVKAVL